MSRALRSRLAQQLAPIIGGDLADGHAQRRAIVDVARDPEHPLHNAGKFHWDDDSLAADKYRLGEAGRLIRMAVVRVESTTDDPPKRFRAFVNVPTATGRRYEPIEDVAADPIARAITLREMERAWRDLRRRYGAFDEFWRLVRADSQGGEAA